ncbi:MAG: RidA family protein [Rhodospirillales bacterium]
MLKPHKPDTLHPPFSAYSPGMEADGAKRWLMISGQVGVAKDGAVAAGAEAQMAECWAHILEILASAGMAKENLVKVTGYLTDAADVGLFRDARDRVLDGHEPASTLVVVAALANPDWMVEIEAVAAA